jgi:SAM-dependent methyltransferase
MTLSEPLVLNSGEPLAASSTGDPLLSPFWESSDSTDSQGLSEGGIQSSFRKVAPNGFGDPYNAYPHSMKWFRDGLYVGTTRANLAYRGQWHAKRDPEWLGQIWPVRIPEGSFDIDLRAQIWRFDSVSGEWFRVYLSPLVKGIDGFDVPLSIGFRAMTAFQGPSDSAPALYVPTWGSHQTPETFMLRSIDGLHFELLPELGLPDPKPRALRGLVSFRQLLFASPAAGQQRRQPNIPSRMTILVSRDPLEGKWENACEGNFGNPNNLAVFQMAVFNGYLYAGTLNVNEGFQLWKTDAEGRPPYKWKLVLTHGAYRGKLNQVAMTLQPYGEHLYLGTAIQDGGFDTENAVGPAAPEVLRVNLNDTWDVIAGEPRATPDGLKAPLSGLGPGFGNPFAGYLWSMCAHDGWLYAGNSVWTLFFRYSRLGDRWPGWIREVLGRQTIEHLIERSGGCDLWRTRDGHRWQPVTRNGFGNSYNMGIRNMVSTPHGLFVGTANPFAPEVAIKRLAGWTYETNSRGGLEIWLGEKAVRPNSASPPSSAFETFRCAPSKLLAQGPVTIDGLIDEFFVKSGFRHYGLWHSGIKDVQSACENLMDELLAFIPDKSGNIIDINCYPGETTRYLLKHWTLEKVMGIVRSNAELSTCRNNLSRVQFENVEMQRIRRNAFDAAVWASANGSPEGRFNVLEQCFRLLRPGGRLVCFDIVPNPGEKGFALNLFRLLKAKPLAVHSYERMLRKTGFRDVVVLDVTRESYDAFMHYTQRYFALQRLSYGCRAMENIAAAEAKLARKFRPTCFVIYGLKPEKEQPYED